ncbi:hypothetical protein ACFLTN_05615 [Chloroflexota bacterium]
MNRTLEPKSLKDILSETFTIYKSNFLRLIAIVAIVMVPFAVMLIIFFSSLMLLTVELGTETPSPFIPLILIPIYLAFFAAFILTAGAVIHAVSEQYFNQPVSIGRAYSVAWRRMGDMFWAVVLYVLAMVGIFLAAILISIIIATGTFAASGTSDWLIPFAIAGTLTFAVATAAIYLGTIWNFMVQTALLEGCGPRAALSHSSALVKGSWWRVLGIMLLLSLIVQTIVMIIVMMFYIPAMIVAAGDIMTGIMSEAETFFPTWSMSVPMIGALIANIISMPILIIGETLLYFDLRVRKQGYSLDALANELGLITTFTDTAAIPPE